MSKQLSEKTIELYKKNINRLLEANLDLNDTEAVIKWINTVKNKNGKLFSDSSKKNFLSAIINKVGDVEAYKKEQNRLNEILFGKYEKDGTLNLDKKKEKEANFKLENYENIINTIVKFPEQQSVKGITIEGKRITKKNKKYSLIEDVINFKKNNSNNNIIIYVLFRMFYMYNFRNEVGSLKIEYLQKLNRENENVIYIDNKFNIKIIRKIYKTKNKYGTIVTDVMDDKLQIAILSLAFSGDTNLTKNEYLFGADLDTKRISGIVRNVGLVHIKYPIYPTDIVKLSNSKFTTSVKEMIEKSKNRGHSLAIHTKVYVPR